MLARKYLSVLQHVIAWFFLILLQLALLPKLNFLLTRAEVRPLLYDIVATNILSILFFYCNYLYLLPNYFFGRNRIPFFVLNLFLFTVALLLLYIIHDYNIPHGQVLLDARGMPKFEENPLALPTPTRVSPQPTIFSDTLLYMGSTFFRLLLLLFVAVGVKMNQQLRAVEQDKHEAEISLLKAQINPHFLFNTLNSIYVLALRNSYDTAPSLLKLSTIMRYVMIDSHSHYVSLSKEITYISDYIELQRMRINKHTIIQLELPIQIPESLAIAPLLLIVFIENAFKYGISASVDTIISIQIFIEGKKLKFSCLNTIFKERYSESTCIGLSNIRNRLIILYPDRHILNIDEMNNMYNVYLELEL